MARRSDLYMDSRVDINMRKERVKYASKILSYLIH